MAFFFSFLSIPSFSFTVRTTNSQTEVVLVVDVMVHSPHITSNPVLAAVEERQQGNKDAETC